MKNMIRKIEKVQIPDEFELYSDDLLKIIQYSEYDIVKSSCYSFRLGYLQGKKANSRFRK